MTCETLFDAAHARRRDALLGPLVGRLRSLYSEEEREVLRVVRVDVSSLCQRSGRGFVDRGVLETVMGNLLELAAPGSHHSRGQDDEGEPLASAVSTVADQLYAMIAQSLLAAGQRSGLEESAIHSAFALLHSLPELREKSLWNRFASLRDPALWDAYLLRNCGLDAAVVSATDFVVPLEESIRGRNMDHYRAFMHDLGCDAVVDYQLRLVMFTYPGWRVLFNHDVAHALTQGGAVAGVEGLERIPVPFLPRAISELGARYFQADLHPETRIGDANFLDHTHRGITTGQTGVIGSGCHLLPCTLGGLSGKVQQRHPLVGDYVSIGTDVGVFGAVRIGDGSMIGPNTEIHGRVELGARCRIGASVFIGTIKGGEKRPGRIQLGEGVRVGAGTIVENESELDLVIPDHAHIPARSHVTNDGFGRPRYIQS